MATTSLPAPSLILRQQFARQVASTNQPLSPFIIGPAAHLVRYSVASEQGNGFIGSYDPVGTLIEGHFQTPYAWPGKPTGSSIDADFVKVHLKNAFLRYANDTSETAVFTSRNSLRHPTAVYKTTTYGARTIADGDVQIGDNLLITGVTSGSVPFSLSTYVIGLRGDTIAAVIGGMTAASSNIADSIAATTTTAGGTNSGDITATATGSAYSGLTSRRPSETYTVEVITGGVSGTAKVQVTSASGTDNVASITISALDTPIAIGTRGLTATFAEGTSTSFVVGDRWTIAVTQSYTAPTVATGGTYAGTIDRTYIVEVVSGGFVSGNGVTIRVTSQDGTDTLPPALMTINTGNIANPINVGSFGATAIFTQSAGMMLGDKFVVTATAAKEGIVRTLVFAHDIPADVTLNNDSADIRIQFFVVADVELPARSTTVGQLQYAVEESQLLVRAAATASTSKRPGIVSGSLQRLPVFSPEGFGVVSSMYVTYRAWLAASSGLLTVAANDDLDLLIAGPTDPDNLLKYAVSLARGAAGGENVLFFNIGDPSIIDNWTTALTSASRIRSAYGHVPLTLDQDVLDQVFSHVQALSGESNNYYRVLWSGSNYLTGGPVLSSANSEDNAEVLVTVEDDNTTSGTQWTLLRITSANANFLTAGVRPGDQIRLNYAINGWGDATYDVRTVDRVLSATQLTVTAPFASSEVIPKRVEIHRTFNGTELRTAYADEATARPSDLVRYVLAPRVTIGSSTLPSYFACALLAGMRATQPAQRSLSRMSIPGIASVIGLSSLTVGHLDGLAADGAMILTEDPENGTVIVRHGVTTGETEILAIREESMVSARHANLFAIVDRLKPYVAQINIADATMDDLADLIRAELDSVKRGLQARNISPELGGQLVDLVITFIGESAASADTLKIIMSMALGRPGNYIDASVLIS